jgi:hypothetical protein
MDWAAAVELVRRAPLTDPLDVIALERAGNGVNWDPAAVHVRTLHAYQRAQAAAEELHHARRRNASGGANAPTGAATAMGPAATAAPVAGGTVSDLSPVSGADAGGIGGGADVAASGLLSSAALAAATAPQPHELAAAAAAAIVAGDLPSDVLDAPAPVATPVAEASVAAIVTAIACRAPEALDALLAAGDMNHPMYHVPLPRSRAA